MQITVFIFVSGALQIIVNAGCCYLFFIISQNLFLQEPEFKTLYIDLLCP